MWRVFVGAALLAAGIVALIEAHSHRPPNSLLGTPAPHDLAKSFGGSHVLGTLTLYRSGSEWSRTAYDFAHIGGAVLIVVGALLMIVGLIALARRPASS